MAHPSKTKHVCQTEIIKIWNDIKQADYFRKRVECFKSHVKNNAKKIKATPFKFR